MTPHLIGLDRVIEGETLSLILKKLKLPKSQKEAISGIEELVIHPKFSSGYRRVLKHIVEGIRYCPLCLAADKTPYFRWYWKLKISTFCHNHQCVLKDTCPHCTTKVKFWATKWDQPITSCYNCGKSLLQARYKIQFLPLKLVEKEDFQTTLFQIIKTKLWNNTIIDPIYFINQLWKVGWAETVDRTEWRPDTENRKKWRPVIYKSPTLKVYTIIRSAFKAIMQSRYRLRRPFNCLKCGNDYTQLKYLITHAIKYMELTCPNQNCNGRDIRITMNGFRCRNCGSIFLADGTILQENRPPDTCPLDKCLGKDIRVIDEHFRCRLCHTEFHANGIIIKEGKLPPKRCPLKICDGADIRRKSDGFRCRDCGTEFSIEGIILKKGIKKIKKCENCSSTDVRIKGQVFRCNYCGAILASNGIIFNSERAPKGCPYCNSRPYLFKKTGNGFRCRWCGSYFTSDGTITKKGYKRPQNCPFCGCKRIFFLTRKKALSVGIVIIQLK